MRLGRNEGGKISRAPIRCGERRKVPKMSQVLSSIQYIYFRKTSGSNTGSPNLLLVPGATYPRYDPGMGCLRKNKCPIQTSGILEPKITEVPTKSQLA